MIIVEGPDGAGKSSLVEKLARDLDLPVAEKAVSGSMQSLVSLKHYVDQAIDKGWHPVLYDRFALISSPIYTAFSRRTAPQEGFDDFTWSSTAYSRFRDLAPTTIICLPPFETVWQNCQRDEDNKRLFPNRAVLGSVYWLYFNLAARNPSTFVYDYTEHDYKLVLHYCEAMIYTRGNE